MREDEAHVDFDTVLKKSKKMSLIRITQVLIYAVCRDDCNRNECKQWRANLFLQKLVPINQQLEKAASSLSSQLNPLPEVRNLLHTPILHLALDHQHLALVLLDHPQQLLHGLYQGSPSFSQEHLGQSFKPQSLTFQIRYL